METAEHQGDSSVDEAEVYPSESQNHLMMQIQDGEEADEETDEEADETFDGDDQDYSAGSSESENQDFENGLLDVNEESFSDPASESDEEENESDHADPAKDRAKRRNQSARRRPKCIHHLSSIVLLIS